MRKKLLCSKCSKEIDTKKPFARIRIGIEPLESESGIKDMSFHIGCSPLIFSEFKDYRELEEDTNEELRELKRHYDDLSDNYSILQDKYGDILKENDKLSKLSKLPLTDLCELNMLREFKKTFNEVFPDLRTATEIEQATTIRHLEKQIKNMRLDQREMSQNCWELKLKTQEFLGEITGCTTRLDCSDKTVKEIASICDKASKELLK